MQPCVRQLVPSDRPAYLEAFAGLSPTTRYLRFAGPKPRLTQSELTYLIDVDHDSHEALLAYDCATGQPVGIGRYVRLPGAPSKAEAAITVLDDWQGQGVGTHLLAELSARAAEHGITRLRADVLRANGRALRLLRSAGWRAVEAEGLMVTLERPLAPPVPAAPARSRAAVRSASRRPPVPRPAAAAAPRSSGSGS